MKKHAVMRSAVGGGLVTIFDDTFGDGVPPPSAPDILTVPPTPASYAVQGTPTEAGGKLRLDTVGALVTPGIGIPGNVFVESAFLLTSISPLNTLGLRQGTAFSATAIFDLAIPGPIRESYNVALLDGTDVILGNDFLWLGVARQVDGVVRVRLRHLDRSADTAEDLESVDLDSMHDQIALTLAKLDAGSDAITASFAYVDGGVVGNPTPIATTPDIFHGEDWTRAGVILSSPVPAAAAPGPSGWLLLGVGFAGAVSLVRKPKA